MKILWLTNFALPIISEDLGISKTFNESWHIGPSSILANDQNYELYICFPQVIAKKNIFGNVKGISYIGYYDYRKKPWEFVSSLESVFFDLLSNLKPDIVHIMGTEYSHSYSMIKACEKFDILKSTIVSIQGLVSKVAYHYTSYLPYNIVNKFTSFRDIVKFENIIGKRKKFAIRGLYELNVIKSAKNIIGRTEWDMANTYFINRDAHYYKCNESLRNSFYYKKWNIRNIQRYSLFMSQATYPIKGLHIVLDAISLLIEIYPDLTLYVSGFNFIDSNWYRRDSYANYIRRIIHKKKLKEHIVFTGPLDETEISNRFLQSHVYISASSIENSSNSVCESGIIGVPTVASYVGGITSMITHKIDGFLYPADEPEMLAYYVKHIFDDDDVAIRISKNAQENFMLINNIDNNVNQLKYIYNKIKTGNDKE